MMMFFVQLFGSVILSNHIFGLMTHILRAAIHILGTMTHRLGTAAHILGTATHRLGTAVHDPAMPIDKRIILNFHL